MAWTIHGYRNEAGAMSRGRLKRTAGLVALGLLSAIVSAAQPGPREQWLTATSGPFTIYSNARPAKTQDVLLALEQLRTVISAMSPVAAGSERPTVLYAFANRQSGAPYFTAPARSDVVHMSEYLVGLDATHIVLNAAENPAEVLPWVYRAYLGQELLRRFPELPLWARSGLGHFYATMQVEKQGTVRIGRPDKHHLDMLRKVNWIPLGQFFGLNRDSGIMNSGRSRQIFEAQAWLLTHYLMTATPKEGKGQQRPASAFFAALDSGLTPEEGLRQVFGLGIEGFERALLGYSRGATLSYFTITLEDLPQGDYALQPVTLPEMSLRLGQHLVRAHSPPPVETIERHLQPLFADPDLAGDALATLAELRRKSGRLGEAERLYERALAARPSQALSYLKYADFLADSGASVEVQRQALESALERNPNLGDAWAKLAKTHRGGGERDYARHLERALEFMPERTDLAYNLAMAHLRAGDSAAARQVVAQRLRNPDDRQLVTDALSEIGRFETVSASNQALRSGDLDSAIEGLEAALAQAADPVTREQIQGALDRLERQAARQARVDRYNNAVAMLNEGRKAEARESLATLLEEVEDGSLKTAIQDVLAQLE